MRDLAPVTQPIFSSRLQTQDYWFSVALPAGIWRWVTRVDVSLATPSYEVRDVTSPFGTLRDMIPIPGPVILAMADSITTIQQAFSPAIMLSPAGTLVFTLNQGQGVSVPQTISITNNGVFGSLLSSSISTSAPWIQVTPANVNGLAFNKTGSFNVTTDSSALLAVDSPYAGTLTIQDPSATNNPQTIPVTVNVLPPAKNPKSSLPKPYSCPHTPAPNSRHEAGDGLD